VNAIVAGDVACEEFRAVVALQEVCKGDDGGAEVKAPFAVGQLPELGVGFRRMGGARE